tara:strand:+ start:958 stop:1404 length:447 start_codon:yes stop_codon:yes gene_type:complete
MVRHDFNRALLSRLFILLLRLRFVQNSFTERFNRPILRVVVASVASVARLIFHVSILVSTITPRSIVIAHRARLRARPRASSRARTNAYILSPSHRVVVTYRDVLLHLVRAHAHRTLHVREHGELFLAREPVAFEGGVIDVDRHLESV